VREGYEKSLRVDFLLTPQPPPATGAMGWAVGDILQYDVAGGETFAAPPHRRQCAATS